MAQELQFYGNPDTQSGLNVKINIFNSNGIEVFSNLQTQEINNAAIYIADMPTLSADNYIVRFFSTDNFVVQGCIDWDGEKEIEDINIKSNNNNNDNTIIFTSGQNSNNNGNLSLTTADNE